MSPLASPGTHAESHANPMRVEQAPGDGGRLTDQEAQLSGAAPTARRDFDRLFPPTSW